MPCRRSLLRNVSHDGLFAALWCKRCGRIDPLRRASFIGRTILIGGIASARFNQIDGVRAVEVDLAGGAVTREIVVGKVLGVVVADLHHYLDLPVDTPGPARRLAEQLSSIVRAATVGDAGIAWERALPRRRRPANRRCPGRMIVLRTEPGSPLRWKCSVCDDEGVISNWADSLFDLRPRRLTLADPSTRSSSLRR